MKHLPRQEIINSNPIPDFLKKMGVVVKGSPGGKMSCLCPIHGEKTPSFTVTPDGILFHCFGCGAGGTIIDLVAKLDNISVGHAMKKLSQGTKIIIKTPPKPVQKEIRPSCDLKEQFIIWKAMTRPAKVVELAEMLSVDPMSLYLLGCAYNEEDHFWAFPMRDGRGNTIGIRTRFKDGKKMSVKGSRSGLFFNPGMTASKDELLICEGVSDCAAALTMGFQAIGRPSCNGQEDLVNDFIKYYRIRRVVIVGDNDEGKKLPNGKMFYPGQEGAAKLQATLKIPSVICITPGKDLRGMIEDGAGPDLVRYLWKDKLWVTPK